MQKFSVTLFKNIILYPSFMTNSLKSKFNPFFILNYVSPLVIVPDVSFHKSNETFSEAISNAT